MLNFLVTQSVLNLQQDTLFGNAFPWRSWVPETTCPQDPQASTTFLHSSVSRTSPSSRTSHASFHDIFPPDLAHCVCIPHHHDQVAECLTQRRTNQRRHWLLSMCASARNRRFSRATRSKHFVATDCCPLLAHVVHPACHLVYYESALGTHVDSCTAKSVSSRQFGHLVTR